MILGCKNKKLLMRSKIINCVSKVSKAMCILLHPYLTAPCSLNFWDVLLVLFVLLSKTLIYYNKSILYMYSTYPIPYV